MGGQSEECLVYLGFRIQDTDTVKIDSYFHTVKPSLFFLANFNTLASVRHIQILYY